MGKEESGDDTDEMGTYRQRKRDIDRQRHRDRGRQTYR